MLVDTSVWIDHLRRGNVRLAERLERAEVFCHPLIIGELACGQLRNRETILSLLQVLPQLPCADHHEVMAFVTAQQLMGAGLGWIDAHLLASSKLAGTTIWSLDKRLVDAARQLSLLARP